MEKFFIEGPSRLEGEVVISGAKNAAVAIIPAVLFGRRPCVLENIPNINDVNISLQILQELGAKIKMRNKTTVEIDATHIIAPSVPFDIARNMRASYYFLGALLGACYSKGAVTARWVQFRRGAPPLISILRDLKLWERMFPSIMA